MQDPKQASEFLGNLLNTAKSSKTKLPKVNFKSEFTTWMKSAVWLQKSQDYARALQVQNIPIYC